MRRKEIDAQIKSEVERFENFLVSRAHTDKTIKEYTNYIRRFFEFCFENRVQIETITQPQIEAFRITINGQGSQKLMSSVVKTYYKYRLITFGDRIPDFVFDTGRREFKQQFIPTLEQIQKMRKTCIDNNIGFYGKRARAIIEVLISCAIREMELSSIKIEDINLKTQRILIHGKGKKERYVFLTPEALKALQDYIGVRKNNVNTLLFYARGTYKPLSHSNISKIFENIQSKAEITDVRITPHSIRRAVASSLARNGTSIYTIQNLLGHSSVDTTSRYINISTDTAEKEIIKLHPFSTKAV